MTRLHPLRLIRLGIDLVLGTAIAAGITLAALGYAGPQLGLTPVVLRGDSMAPHAPVGSLVVVQQVDPALVATGDVVTYRVPDGGVVTHRVTQVDRAGAQRSFVVKGDNNAAADPVPVEASWILGREVVAVPVVGYYLSFISQPWGWPTLLGLLVLVFLAGSFRPNGRRSAAEGGAA